MASGTKSDLVKNIQAYGENPPSSWKVPQLKARLAELQVEVGNPISPMKALEKNLNKLAGQKKSLLVNHLTQQGIALTGNETVAQLVSHGLRTGGEQIPGHSEDVLGFGVHASKTYGEVKSTVPSYASWVMTTYLESGQEEACSWRLKRFAKWLLEEEKQGPIVPKVKAKAYPAGATSSDGSLVMVPQISETEEEMLSDNESKIAQLEAQLLELRRSKKERRSP